NIGGFYSSSPWNFGASWCSRRVRRSISSSSASSASSAGSASLTSGAASSDGASSSGASTTGSASAGGRRRPPPALLTRRPLGAGPAVSPTAIAASLAILSSAADLYGRMSPL